MSFGSPALLSGLILVPLAVLAYAALQHRRRREAAAWANPALVPGLLTGRPGWRRHLPPLLVGIALTALVIALARPERTVAVPQRQATVVLVTDVSSSMNAPDVRPTRLAAAVSAAKTLAQKLPASFRLGLVSFSDFAELRAAPTTDHSQVQFALDELQADGDTAMGEGLQRGLVAATTPVPGPDGTGVRRLPAAIILLSDGANTSGPSPLDAAREAKRQHVPIYTIALGSTDIGLLQQLFGFRGSQLMPDPETLAQIARISGGKAYTAADAEKLQSIYSKLGTGLTSKPEKHEITADFVGGALAFLLAAGGLSLRWFGRLV